MESSKFTRLPGIYVIIDRNLYKDNSIFDKVSESIEAGVRLFQYREKDINKRESYPIVLKIRDIVKKANGIFVINDYLDLALAVDADGLHIGQDDIPLSTARNILGRRKIIGVSTHNIEEALRADTSGADYIGIGPIFETRSKITMPPIGTEIIMEIKKRIQIPVYAIGGIGINNLDKAISAGADGVALISAIFGSNDMIADIKNMSCLIKNSKERL